MADSIRENVFQYVKEKYKTDPEYLWARFRDYAVFRHCEGRKWFGIVMNISYDKIDSSKSGMVDVLNVKVADPLLRDMLIQQDGYYDGYHIRRGNWISVVLDGTIPFETIRNLIDESYSITASKNIKQKLRPPKEWLIPSNPKYYDIVHAFDDTDVIDWKQGAGIKKNDTVFLYVGSPVSAVLYKCKVIKTDIPYDFHTDGLTIRKLMTIKLQKRYAPEAFTFERLKNEFSIYAVRGPRGVTNSLSNALNKK